MYRLLSSDLLSPSAAWVQAAAFAYNGAGFEGAKRFDQQLPDMPSNMRIRSPHPLLGTP